MNILLTGSSGTVGTKLFEELLRLNYDVTGVDRRENKWNKSLNKKTVLLDLLKKEEVARLPKKIDLIVHFAANARVYELVKNPDMALENIITMYNVLEFARKNNIKKILFSSSRETYGNLINNGAISEDEVRIGNCESPYSSSKICAETMIQSYNKVYGIDFVIVRFSNVYGMYDDSDRVIPLWIRQTLKNEDLTVFGEKKVLDFTYIEDTVAGVIKAIERFDKVKGETINIASGESTKLMYVAERIRALLNAKNKLNIKGNRLGEVWTFQADITKAKALLGYKPKTTIDKGLEKTLNWYTK